MRANVWLRTMAVAAVAMAAGCTKQAQAPAAPAASATSAAAAPSAAPSGAPAAPSAPIVPASMPAPGASGDCPFVGALQNFSAPDKPIIRTYDSYDFRVVDGGKAQMVTKTGQFCEQIYRLRSGLPPLSALEIMTNYQQSLAAAGAQVTNVGRSDDDDIYATVTKGGAAYWLYLNQKGGTTLTVREIGIVPFQGTLLPPSGDDFHLLGHMPQTTPRSPTRVNYDEVPFQVANGSGTQTVKVRGAHERLIYDLPSDRHISSLESQLNYRAALKAIGAQILYEDPGYGLTTARLNDGGKTVWISVLSNAAITIDTLEEKPFQPSVTPPKASEMKTELDRTGRVTLYVNFDFNKATLKPDAAPILAQVVALMKADPSLKLSVDGHTDNVGLHDYNVKLSQARAASVVAALQAQQIGADRLVSAGYGPDKPIAPNDTETGRAKNRRVELVKQ